MTTTPTERVMEALAAPFEEKDLEQRVGATNKDKTMGLALTYITSRAVMDRLDQVVGVDGWKDAIRREGNGFICSLSVRIGGEWITHEDGAPETATEGYKGGISDALKRAAVKFGIGRYLYSLESEWKPIEPFGKSVRFKKGGTVSSPKPRPAPERTRQDPRNVGQAAESVVRGTIPAKLAKMMDLVTPPFDIAQPLGFGKKFRDKAWGHMALGSPDGERREFLQWVIGKFDDGPVKSKAQLLLDWIAKVEEKEYVEADEGCTCPKHKTEPGVRAHRDDCPVHGSGEPGHVTDEDLSAAGEYQEAGDDWWPEPR